MGAIEAPAEPEGLLALRFSFQALGLRAQIAFKVSDAVKISVSGSVGTCFS